MSSQTQKVVALVSIFNERTKKHFKYVIHAINIALEQDATYLDYIEQVDKKSWKRYQSGKGIFSRSQFERRFRRHTQHLAYHPEEAYQLIRVYKELDCCTVFDALLLSAWTGVFFSILPKLEGLYKRPPYHFKAAIDVFMDIMPRIQTLNWFKEEVNLETRELISRRQKNLSQSANSVQISNSHLPSSGTDAILSFHNPRLFKEDIQRVSIAIKQGNDHDVAHSLNASLSYAKSQRLSPYLGDLHHLQAMLDVKQGHHANAKYHLEEALRYTSDTQQAPIYANLGSNEFYQANYKQAQVHYEKSLNLAQQDDNPLVMSFALMSLGAVASEFSIEGKSRAYPLALSYYEEAMKLAQEMDYKERQAYLYLNIGEIHAATGELPLAMINYLRSQSEARQIGHRQLILQLDLYQAQLKLKDGDIRGARDDVSRVLQELSEEKLMIWLKTLALIEKGRLTLQAGHLISSMESFYLALALAIELNNTEFATKALYGIALSLSDKLVLNPTQFIDLLPPQFVARNYLKQLGSTDFLKAQQYFATVIDSSLQAIHSYLMTMIDRLT